METPKTVAAGLPHVPGVYLFRNSSNVILYIGKAKDLRRRVIQYFLRDDAVGEKTKILVAQISTIKTIETQSEFDALLLEAKLIREHKPKYNVIAKDDKSPLYVAITLDEELPRILFVRKTAIETTYRRAYFGPFQSGRAVRTLVRELRRIIPYCTQKQRDGKPCFYTHLGLCNPCPSLISVQPPSGERDRLVSLYRRNIRLLVDILSGKSRQLLHQFQDEMKELSAQERFEEAGVKKRTIDRLQILLEKHYDPSFYVQEESLLEHMYGTETKGLEDHLRPYYQDIAELRRIECVDISNTGGTYATGSLVVLSGGKPTPADYRRFRIRTTDGPNDFTMIAEVVRRRLRHPEWPFPDLLVIDGGKGQVAAAAAELALAGSTIPLIGLAKRFEEIIIPRVNKFITVRLPLSDHGLHLLQRVRDESHRFALTYHRKLRKKAFIR